LADISLASFVLIAGTLFITELTDKDSLLLIAVSTRVRARIAFFAGATAFIITTTIIVTLGSLLIEVVPVEWVRIAGGIVMIGYGLWEARGLVGQRAVESEESRIARAGSAWKVFAALVFALAVLDLAGDATEVLTIVLVARYSDPLFVFSGVCLGLLSATAVETTLGSRLGTLLTPRRLRIGSAAVFLFLGTIVVLFGSV
jgi:Ca2+/H+ antiporter, TMEM165/GDT1 family